MSSEVKEFIVVAPLVNFRLGTDSLALDDSTSLVRVKGDDYRHLADNYSYLPDYNEIAVTAGACTHAIRMRAKGTADDVRSDQEIEVHLQNVLRALRLHQSGRVGLYFTLIRDTTGAVAWLRHPHIRSFHPIPPPYVLSAEDGPYIVDLVSRIEARDPSPTYELAMRRFERTYERLDPEDRLIDLWVALEALYGGGGQTELSFRIALRIAALLEPNAREPLFEKMRRSYASRSKIVHGSRPKADWHELLETTESVVRTSLRRALNSDWPSDSNEMDSRILSSPPAEKVRKKSARGQQTTISDTG